MNEKVLNTLEYNKILEMLANKANSAPGKKLCRELMPSTDIEEIRRNQRQTADALRRLFKLDALFSDNLRHDYPSSELPYIFSKVISSYGNTFECLPISPLFKIMHNNFFFPLFYPSQENIIQNIKKANAYYITPTVKYPHNLPHRKKHHSLKEHA